MHDYPTILDLFDNYFDINEIESVDGLDEKSINDLAEEIHKYYDSYTIPNKEEGMLRVYLGGWSSHNYLNGQALQEINNSLLYAHQVVLHDIIAFLLHKRTHLIKGLGPFRYPCPDGTTLNIEDDEGSLLSDAKFNVNSNVESYKKAIKQRLELYRRLKPLIERGVVLLVPHIDFLIKTETQIITSTRYDVRDPHFIKICNAEYKIPLAKTDYIRGGQLTQSIAHPILKAQHTARNISYHYNKDIITASLSQSSYCPICDSDWALIEYYFNKLVRYLSSKDIESKIIPLLSSIDIPDFTELDPTTLIKIRENDENFEDFRREIRLLIKEFANKEISEDTRKAANEALNDHFKLQIHNIRNLTNTSTIIKKAAREGTLALCIPIASALFGIPFEDALSLGAITGIFTFLYNALFKNNIKNATSNIYLKLIKK